MTSRWWRSRSAKKSSPASTPSRLLGHLAAWNYFESIKNPKNAAFIKEWQAFTKNPKRVTNDPMEAHVIGFAMWVKAVEKVKSTDPDKVIERCPASRRRT
jgi:ABC-type branched-chain amino acid transport systems, periplasmic component